MLTIEAFHNFVLVAICPFMASLQLRLRTEPIFLFLAADALVYDGSAAHF